MDIKPAAFLIQLRYQLLSPPPVPFKSRGSAVVSGIPSAHGLAIMPNLSTVASDDRGLVFRTSTACHKQQPDRVATTGFSSSHKTAFCVQILLFLSFCPTRRPVLSQLYVTWRARMNRPALLKLSARQISRNWRGKDHAPCHKPLRFLHSFGCPCS